MRRELTRSACRAAAERASGTAEGKLAAKTTAQRSIRRVRATRPTPARSIREICAVLLLPFLLSVASCSDRGDAATAPAAGGGDAARGRAEIAAVGCGSCHMIPGITAAKGLVGPPLDHMGRRIFLAGLLRNTPDNMTRWIENPQKIVPGNAMPDMGLSQEQARDITAYLYTLQ